MEWAEAEAAKPFELCEWYQPAYRVEPDEFELSFELHKKSPECGTCYCIAGYVAAMVQPSRHWHYSDDIAQGAMRALGLGDDQASDLFDAGNSIVDVRRIAEGIAGERL